nr:vitamin K epoxide reductase family protein [Corynebacterium auriscanis]
MTETPAAAVATNTAPTASSAPATTLDRSARGLPASRGFAILMLVLAAIGLWFSTLIMYDKIKLVLDSSFTPACTLNDVVSCSDVMASSQASAFGFPNPFIGMIGFPVVMTIAVVLLVGARLPRWLWWSVVVGLGLAVVFVHWLAFQAIFNIVALCLGAWSCGRSPCHCLSCR